MSCGFVWEWDIKCAHPCLLAYLLDEASAPRHASGELCGWSSPWLSSFAYASDLSLETSYCFVTTCVIFQNSSLLSFSLGLFLTRSHEERFSPVAFHRTLSTLGFFKEHKTLILIISIQKEQISVKHIHPLNCTNQLTVFLSLWVSTPSGHISDIQRIRYLQYNS